MPSIYDNSDGRKLADAIRDTLRDSQRADFCVGYFNLRGWRKIVSEVQNLQGDEKHPPCRLIVGMAGNIERGLRDFYADISDEMTNERVTKIKKEFAQTLKKQLTWGVPTPEDEKALRRLARQLRNKILRVGFFGAYPLHAKLYLAHLKNGLTAGYVGSSNLTLAGMERQGELNLDVLDEETTEKLTTWFEERWNHRWCLDISDELAEIIETSWAGGPIPPYHIYIKTAYELSKEAIEGARDFRVPREFDKVMLEFQKQAVSLAARHLNRNKGVIIGDVVGLGKTLVACAVARIFQDDIGGRTLVICPPKLREMWRDYIRQYDILGDTLSLGRTAQLKEEIRCRVVIIDESHNLRNRESRRYAEVRDYIRENDSHVILLTATPYNKQFTDISNQLRLFVDHESSIGIRPEAYINSCGGVSHFMGRHPNISITSLAAFEHSDLQDDWRELIRMFAVRRTRSHIKKSFAKFDAKKKRHYLSFPDGGRFYLPKRKAKRELFSLKKGDPADQYALLYSEKVVNIIGDLKLPRYGLATYLLIDNQTGKPVTSGEKERKIVDNLSRAGRRLLGFAKSNLFKRLESSGPAFLSTIKRHIVRNAVFLSVLEKGGELPIGDVPGPLADETLEERGDDVLVADWEQDSLEKFLEAGRNAHRYILTTPAEKRKFSWLRSDLFDKKKLGDELLRDCRELLQVLATVPQWNPDADRKLDALANLCLNKHKDEKLLVFTQFKDTADYLFKKLQNRGMDQNSMAMVFGGTDNISGVVKKFSPISNNAPKRDDELRVLITTDTLSEGQNLQDAHIVVNFDLPWAIIRLVQRAGRVDRIGQKADTVLCYSFLPEKGIEDIINLRNRLQGRLRQNAELVGSDEIFFKGDRAALQKIFDEQFDLEEDEDETDLVSRAYDIWQQAIEDDEDLKKKIPAMPDVVYSGKRAKDGVSGAIAYIQTSHKQHVLAHLNERREIVSQSQSKILDLLACGPEEPPVAPPDSHHELVATAVRHVQDGHADIGGQLGGSRSVRNRLYGRLKSCLAQKKETVFDDEVLKQATEAVFHRPLQDSARDTFARQFRYEINDDSLVTLVESLHLDDKLCISVEEGAPIDAQIICSMGLVE